MNYIAIVLIIVSGTIFVIVSTRHLIYRKSNMLDREYATRVELGHGYNYIDQMRKYDETHRNLYKV